MQSGARREGQSQKKCRQIYLALSFLHLFSERVRCLDYAQNAKKVQSTPWPHHCSQRNENQLRREKSGG